MISHHSTNTAKIFWVPYMGLASISCPMHLGLPPKFCCCSGVISLHIFITMSFKLVSFYRAMHFSAKRGLAIACRLSVCPSVRPSVTLVDCDHLGWNSSEIISPLVSPGCLLSADPNNRGLLQGNTRKVWPKVTHHSLWCDARWTWYGKL